MQLGEQQSKRPRKHDGYNEKRCLNKSQQILVATDVGNLTSVPCLCHWERQAFNVVLSPVS